MTPWIFLSAAFALSSGEAIPAAAEPAAAAPVTIGHSEGVLALGAGLALGVTSVTAFSVGFEIERQLRAGEVRGASADEALSQRTVAALVAWPAAVLSVVGLAGGAYVLAASEDIDAGSAGHAVAGSVP